MDFNFPFSRRKETRANTMAKSAKVVTKQKIALKIPMEDAKMRAKALKLAVGIPGVISVQIDGEKMVVIGEGFDPVALIVMLRKKMGFAELVSVSAVDEKKEEQKKTEVAAGAAPSNPLHARSQRSDGDGCCVM